MPSRHSLGLLLLFLGYSAPVWATTGWELAVICADDYAGLKVRPDPLVIARGVLGKRVYSEVEIAVRRAVSLGRAPRVALESQITLVYPALIKAGLSEKDAITAINDLIAAKVLGQTRSPLLRMARAFHAMDAKQRLTSLEGRQMGDYQATMAERTGKKLAVIHDWLPTAEGASVVDIGTGTGHVPASLAAKYPKQKFTGIDLSPEMIDAASRTHSGNNLSFHRVDASGEWPGGPYDAATLISVVHEVYSYAGPSAFEGMLATAHSNLKKGGRLIIKDFNGPAEPNKLVVLTQDKSKLKDQSLTPYSFSDFARAVAELRGDASFKIRSVDGEKIEYETPMWLAYEYMYHLKYLGTSPKEVMEKYGFWNAAEAKTTLEKAGFKVVHVKEFDDGNVVETRLKGSLSLSDPGTGKPIDYPIRKLIIVGEKP